MAYFHGGRPGLKPGSFILPPSITRAAHTGLYGARGVHNPERVYVTTNVHGALLFAAGYPRGEGEVYEVEPVGEIEHDPDTHEPGFSFQCPKARILKVIRVPRVILEEARKVVGLTGLGKAVGGSGAMKNSAIEWTDHTFNPWVGCQKVSPACDHCYAEGWAKRSGSVEWGGERRRTTPANWRQPLRWNAEAEASGRRARVFCASLADVFDNQVPAEWRRDLFNLILSTPSLDWLLLTKRIGNAARLIDEVLPDNMKALPSDCPVAWPWPNVWIGATVCNQDEADRDIPKLLQVPARVRFLSIEPMLGPIDLGTIHNTTDLAEGQPYLHPLRGFVSDGHGDVCSCAGIDWVIVGGESGPGARPMHPDWARSLRDQCVEGGVPFLFKQWGEWVSVSEVAGEGAHHHFADGATVRRIGKKVAGRTLDGQLHDGVPT